MVVRNVDRNAIGLNEDWEGNNAAFSVPPAIRFSLLVHCCMVANANVLIAVSQRVMCMAVNRPAAPPV